MVIPDEKILLVATYGPTTILGVIHTNKCRSVQLLGHHGVPCEIYHLIKFNHFVSTTYSIFMCRVFPF